MKLITGGLVWQGASRGFVRDVDILIEGSLIKEVAPGLRNDPQVRGAEVFDASGSMIIPGLVNTHTHAAMTLLRSYADDLPLQEWLTQKIWPVEAKLTSDDVYWGTMLAIVEMVRAGVTTFADMYFYMDRVAEAVAETGMRAGVSVNLFDDDAFERNMADAEALYRNWHGQADGRIQVMLGPHAPYSAPGAMVRAAEAAKEWGVMVSIHLAETRREVEESLARHGLTPIAFAAKEGVLDAAVLAAHCVHVTPEDLDILKEKDVKVVHNPTANMKLGSGRAPVEAMLERGIVVALGTDGPSSNNNLDLLEEARLAAFLAKMEERPTALPAPVCLEMATVAGARALGHSDIGHVAPGYQADLVWIDMSGPHWQPAHDPCAHLIYSASSRDVTDVMVAGRFLMRKGELTTIDEERVLSEAARRGLDLVSQE